jgi:hypothetical protein
VAAAAAALPRGNDDQREVSLEVQDGGIPSR